MRRFSKMSGAIKKQQNSNAPQSSKILNAPPYSRREDGAIAPPLLYTLLPMCRICLAQYGTVGAIRVFTYESR